MINHAPPHSDSMITARNEAGVDQSTQTLAPAHLLDAIAQNLRALNPERSTGVDAFLNGLRNAVQSQSTAISPAVFLDLVSAPQEKGTIDLGVAGLSKHPDLKSLVDAVSKSITKNYNAELGAHFYDTSSYAISEILRLCTPPLFSSAVSDLIFAQVKAIDGVGLSNYKNYFDSSAAIITDPIAKILEERIHQLGLSQLLTAPYGAMAGSARPGYHFRGPAWALRRCQSTSGFALILTRFEGARAQVQFDILAIATPLGGIPFWCGPIPDCAWRQVRDHFRLQERHSAPIAPESTISGAQPCSSLSSTHVFEIGKIPGTSGTLAKLHFKTFPTPFHITTAIWRASAHSQPG